MKSNCEHNTTTLSHKVTKLTNNLGAVTRWRLDLELTCTDCLRPFEFLAELGYSTENPTRSIEGLELRIPMKLL